MDENIKSDLSRCLADAKAKLEELPDRIKAEREAAANDDPPRKPFPVVPMTEIESEALAAALAEIKELPEGPLKETITTFGKSCRRHNAPLIVRCDQLAEVLQLAGIE
jgi:hypothetical protein